MPHSLEHEPRRIACVGASVTFGRGLANRRVACYPAVLQRLLDASLGDRTTTVKNLGYSGATISRQGNEPYWATPSFTAATRFEPDMTLLMLGTNDAQFENATARHSLAQDLADLVAHFRTWGEVLVAQMPPAFPPVAEIDFVALQGVVRPTVARVATEIRAPLVDFLSPLADTSEHFPDGLHPTAPIAKQIAHIAHDALIPLLAK